MKRTQLNFVVDAAAFVLLLLLLATGLVLAHQLPPGSGGEHGAGVGRGAAERAVTLLWGWTRHQWGDVHYWIAYGLLAALALHVVLHGKWIVCVVRGKPSEASPHRLLLGTVGLAFLVAMTAAPLVSPTTVMRRGELQRDASPAMLRETPAAAASETAAAGKRQPVAGPVGVDAADAGPSLRGSMTLGEIAAATGVPLDAILEKLNLPPDADPNERAGRFLRQHGLEMTDLRTALELPEHGE